MFEELVNINLLVLLFDGLLYEPHVLSDEFHVKHDL
jgi:hypothetical protein